MSRSRQLPLPRLLATVTLAALLSSCAAVAPGARQAAPRDTPSRAPHPAADLHRLPAPPPFDDMPAAQAPPAAPEATEATELSPAPSAPPESTSGATAQPEPADGPDAAGPTAGQAAGSPADIDPEPVASEAAPAAPEALTGDPDVAWFGDTQLQGQGWKAAERPIAYRTDDGWEVSAGHPVLLAPQGRVVHATQRFSDAHGLDVLRRAAAAVSVPGVQLVVADAPVASADRGDGRSTVELSDCSEFLGITHRRATVEHLLHPGGEEPLVGVVVAGEADVLVCDQLTGRKLELVLAHELLHALGLDHVEGSCSLMASRMGSGRCKDTGDEQARAGVAELYRQALSRGWGSAAG